MRGERRESDENKDIRGIKRDNNATRDLQQTSNHIYDGVRFDLFDLIH